MSRSVSGSRVSGKEAEMLRAFESFVSQSWDVAHAKGPALAADEVGNAPSEKGAYGQASLYRDAHTQDLVGGSVKLGTGEMRERPTPTPQGASGEAGGGHFLDAAGDPAYGFWAEGQVQKTSGDLFGSSTKQPGESADPHSYLGYEASLADGSIGVKTTPKCAQMSAQGSGPTFALAAGTRGTTTDSYAKAGVSPMGPGGGLRLHYGDDDGDQLPEYGFGIDVGCFTGDFKTEDPVGLLARTLSGTREPPDGHQKNYTKALKDLYHGFVD
jgi:hypothetical protein